jgi:hypothetical protein
MCSPNRLTTVESIQATGVTSGNLYYETSIHVVSVSQKCTTVSALRDFLLKETAIRDWWSFVANKVCTILAQQIMNASLLSANTRITASNYSFHSCGTTLSSAELILYM